jgi:hypothetical protein
MSVGVMEHYKLLRAGGAVFFFLLLPITVPSWKV